MTSVRLLQLTDLHLFGEANGQLRGVTCLPALQAALADAQRHFPRPDAVLLTGDLVQDDPEGYRWVRQVFANSRVPVLCLAGNHDLPDHMRAMLRGGPFQVGGHAGFGNWRVVMLDSWIEHDAGGRIGVTQLEWLEQVLQQYPDQHVLVCLHHHPIAMGSDWLDQVGLYDADEFMGLLRRHRNVRAVLWGHVHQSLDTWIEGVHFMATPATCAQFLPGSAEFALDDRPPGYRVLELHADGTLQTEVCWLESPAQSSVA